jgi:hypothetical protein
VLDVAGLAPRGEDIDQRNVAFAQIRAADPGAAVEARQLEFWRRLADQRGR